MIHPAEARCLRRMRGLLQRGLSFGFGQECVEGLDFGGREGDAGVLPGPAVARLDALHDGAGGTGGNRSQLDRPPGIFQLAVLRLQSLLLQGAEELFDMPALPIPANHAPGHRRILEPMGGQKPPRNRLGARRRIHLANLDKADFHRLGQPFLPGQIGRAPDRAHFFLKTGPKRVTRLAVRAGRSGRARKAIKAVPANCSGAEESLPPPSSAAPFLDRAIRHGAGQDVKARPI